MSIKLIAAIGENNELSKKNQLIWRLPEDLKFFRKMTLGGYVLMGSNTFYSLPKTFDKRTSIVLSTESFDDYSDVIKPDYVDKLVKVFKNSDKELFVIGGANVYQQFIDYVDKMYLTEIHATDNQADTYFPYFDKNLWIREVIDTHKEKNINYDHTCYIRKKVKR